MHPFKDNALCRMLDIPLPILGAPMGGVAGVDLAVAVSEAGGLGVLGHANLAPDVSRRELEEARARSDKPVGIGLLFPSGAPPAPRALPPLPEFLEPLRSGPPGEVPESSYSHAAAWQRLETAMELGVKVLTLGLGAPRDVVEAAQAGGMRVVSLVGSLRAAREVEQSGVDAIVAQGHEAGGHTGRTATMVLVPQVVDAVQVPVIAAGGIVDGRGLAAALMLGASGVLVGTALIATPEARTHANHKARVVELEADETVVSRCYTGKPSRVLRNRFTDAWAGHEAMLQPMPRQWEWMAPLVAPQKAEGSLDVGNWPTGQAATRIRAMAPAGEVVRRMAADAMEQLNRYNREIVT